MDNCKKYMLKCMIKVDKIMDWHDEQFFFDTEEEMIKFVKEGYKELGIEGSESHIRIESAFKLEKLDNSIFIED